MVFAMTVSSSLSSSFFGALEGAFSVFLILFAGYYVAERGLIDRNTIKRVSNLCTVFFLPCLIIVQMGPELTVTNLSKLWIIPLWGLASTLLAHGVGWLGQKALKMPHWTVVASGRPNANALPLLLLQSLQYTSVFDDLSTAGDSVSDTLDRAKSLILLNVIVQQTFTYQFAPSVLKMDKPKIMDANGRDIENQASSVPESRQQIPPIVQDREHVGLLQDTNGHSYGTNGEAHYSKALNAIVDQPDVHWPRSVSVAEKPVKKILRHMSPPLIAAIIAFIIGVRYPCVIYRTCQK